MANKVIKLSIIHFKNPDGEAHDGSDCEMLWSECDTYFIICVKFQMLVHNIF